MDILIRMPLLVKKPGPLNVLAFHDIRQRRSLLYYSSGSDPVMLDESMY
jgi:hypothetical protein